MNGGVRQEAEKVYQNLKRDPDKIAHYIVERCGDFIFDDEREAFIAEFLRAAMSVKWDGEINGL